MATSQFLDLRNPVAFKKVFGNEHNKDILIHFISDIIKFPAPIEKVNFLETSQDGELLEIPQVKVSCTDQAGNSLLVILHMTCEKDFEQTMLCQASQAYCSQSKSQPVVYALAIADFLAFAAKKVWLSRMGIKDLDTHEHDITSIQFYFMQLPLFKKTREDIEGLSIREKWAYLFKYAADTTEQEMEFLAGKHSIIRKVYDLLNSSNWSDQELKAYELMEKKRMVERSILEDVYQQEIQASKREMARHMLERGYSTQEIQQITGIIV